MRSFPICFLLILMLAGCQAKGKQTVTSDLFAAGVVSGVLQNPGIDEASGLDASRVNAGAYWTHNDSAGEPRIFLINEAGESVGNVLLTSVVNRDWEDIAVGAGPREGKSYVYVAEIGDNEAIYPYKLIYRIEEPVISKDQTLTLSIVDSIKFQLPDGQRDTEAIFLDDDTRDLFIFSKREKQIRLYTLPYPQPTDSTTTAIYLATLPLTQIVGADYASTTGELIVKNYDSIFYWKKSPGEAIVDMVNRQPEKLTYTPEPQGESICFRADDSGFFTLSEKKDAPVPLLFYKRR